MTHTRLATQITYDLVITAAGILGVTVPQALEAYGDYFVKYVAAQVPASMIPLALEQALDAYAISQPHRCKPYAPNH